MNRHLLLLILYPSLLATAQVLVKIGSDRVAALAPPSAFDHIANMLLSPWVLAGVGITAGSMLLWFYIISKVELGRAYPFTSLSYVLVQIAAVYLFREQPTVWRWLGLMLIITGVVMVSKS